MDAFGFTSIVFVLLTTIFCLAVWYLLNRASVRANEQIFMLQEIVQQQRKQTDLLVVLLEHIVGANKSSDSDVVINPDFRGLIPKR